ncbi:MAG: hypothetical protein HQ478_05640 [Chloroflexi bacterium]|nr:hypothetical protein [Chloroflexota bacterium]
MTTIEVVERVERPARAIGGRAIAVSAAILAIGIGTIAILAVLFGGGTTLTIYEQSLTPLVVQHNEIVGQWNAFLVDYNGISLETPELYDERALEGKTLTQNLADDTQALIVAWDKVDVPETSATAHGLARDAIRETQDGFIELSIYFGNIIEYGVAFDEDLKAGTSRLNRAALIWAEAKAAAIIAN